MLEEFGRFRKLREKPEFGGKEWRLLSNKFCIVQDWIFGFGSSFLANFTEFKATNLLIFSISLCPMKQRCRLSLFPLAGKNRDQTRQTGSYEGIPKFKLEFKIFITKKRISRSKIGAVLPILSSTSTEIISEQQKKWPPSKPQFNYLYDKFQIFKETQPKK